MAQQNQFRVSTTPGHQLLPRGKTRWPIALKLSAGFGLLLLLFTVGMSLLTFSNLAALNRMVDAMGETVEKTDLLYEIETAFLRAHEGEVTYLAYGIRSEEGWQEVLASESDWKELLATLDTYTLHEEETAFTAQLAILLAQVETVFSQVRDLVDAGDIEGARALHRSATEPLCADIEALYDEEIDFHMDADKTETRDSADRTVEGLPTLLTGIGIAGMAICVAGSVLLATTISRPLRHLSGIARDVTGGNLQVEAQVNSNDETGVLAGAFNQMVTRLREMLESEQEQRKNLQQANVEIERRARAEQEQRENLQQANAEIERRARAEQEQSQRLQDTVKKYVDFMAEVGRGNLAARVRVDGNGRDAPDPLIVLGYNLNDTVASLQSMTAQIREASNNLSAAASEILAATTQQAGGATEQSTAITQATTTIDEVRAIAEQTAQRAQGVVEVAQRTAEISMAGRQSVADTVNGMEQIREKVESIASGVLDLSEQAQAIGAIIATVNEIAAQSNMLALNAAVEAARAGEAGKGFTVVAQEVRSLAEQSRAATDQVREILSEIQRGVNAAVMATEQGQKMAESGVKLTGDSGSSIQRLADSVAESTQAAVQIAAAAGQQVTGVEQIAAAMQSISQATVQNLASTRQAEKAAQNLSDLSRSLVEMVQRYQL